MVQQFQICPLCLEWAEACQSSVASRFRKIQQDKAHKYLNLFGRLLLWVKVSQLNDILQNPIFYVKFSLRMAGIMLFLGLLSMSGTAYLYRQRYSFCIILQETAQAPFRKISLFLQLFASLCFQRAAFSFQKCSCLECSNL